MSESLSVEDGHFTSQMSESLELVLKLDTLLQMSVFGASVEVGHFTSDVRVFRASVEFRHFTSDVRVFRASVEVGHFTS